MKITENFINKAFTPELGIFISLWVKVRRGIKANNNVALQRWNVSQCNEGKEEGKGEKVFIDE